MKKEQLVFAKNGQWSLVKSIAQTNDTYGADPENPSHRPTGSERNNHIAKILQTAQDRHRNNTYLKQMINPENNQTETHLLVHRGFNRLNSPKLTRKLPNDVRDNEDNTVSTYGVSVHSLDHDDALNYSRLKYNLKEKKYEKQEEDSDISQMRSFWVPLSKIHSKRTMMFGYLRDGKRSDDYDHERFHVGIMPGRYQLASPDELHQNIASLKRDHTKNMHETISSKKPSDVGNIYAYKAYDKNKEIKNALMSLRSYNSRIKNVPEHVSRKEHKEAKKNKELLAQHGIKA